MDQPTVNCGQSSLSIEVADTRKRGPDPSFEVSLLGLSLINGLGRKGIRALVRAFRDKLGEVWKASPDQLRTTLANSNIPSAGAIAERIGQDSSKLIDRGNRKLEELRERHIHLLAPSKMPAKLRDIPDPPLWLFVQSDNVGMLHNSPAVAVVGTRSPSAYGLKATRLVSDSGGCADVI
jgi:predicted Rossmann fold nucleotide-binding protein DprA/Smf involved in DNA uptake